MKLKPTTIEYLNSKLSSNLLCEEVYKKEKKSMEQKVKNHLPSHFKDQVAAMNNPLPKELIDGNLKNIE